MEMCEVLLIIIILILLIFFVHISVCIFTFLIVCLLNLVFMIRIFFIRWFVFYGSLTLLQTILMTMPSFYHLPENFARKL